MRKLTIMCVIFVVFLFGCLLYIGYSIEHHNKPYKSFESDLKEIASTYILSNKLNVEVGQQYELTLDKMIEDNMLTTKKVKEDECDGKVTIKRTLSGYDYRPYIKCSKYETVDK